MCPSHSLRARKTLFGFFQFFFFFTVLLLGGPGGCGGGSRGTGFDIEGKVLELNTEVPIGGVTVTVEQTGESAVTDNNGNFRIDSSFSGTELRLSFDAPPEVAAQFSLPDIPVAATGVRVRLFLERKTNAVFVDEVEFKFPEKKVPGNRSTPTATPSPGPTPEPPLPPARPTPDPTPDNPPPPPPPATPTPTATPTSTPSATPTATPSPTPRDRTGPSILSHTVSGITQTSATLSITTDEISTVGITLGATLALGSSLQTSTEMADAHVFTITGLNPSTTYTVSIGATDAAGNLTTDNTTTFRTLDAPPPPPAQDLLFWIDMSAQEVVKSTIPDRTRQTLFSGHGSPTNMRLHPSQQKIYFSDWTTRRINRMNLDGTNVEILRTLSEVDIPGGAQIELALDATRDLLYWTGTNYLSVSFTVRRMDIDGGGLRTMFTAPGRVTSMQLDPVQNKLYWLRDNLSVWRANVDGTAMEQLASFPGFPAPNHSALTGLSIDHVRQKLYWNDFTNGNIWRSNLDGSGAQVVIALGGLGVGGDNSVIQGFAIHPVFDRFFWVDSGNYRVQAANLDGTGRTTLVSSGAFKPYTGIFFEPTQQKLYYSCEQQFGMKIERSNLDGSGLESLDRSQVTFPESIAVDAVHLKLYWRDGTTDGIYRGNFDGSGLERIADSPKTMGGFAGIALDPNAGKVYWNDDWTPTSPLKIRTANLDGSAPQDLVTFPGSDAIRSLAFDTLNNKLYWSYHGIHRSNPDGSNIEQILTEAQSGTADIMIEATSQKLYWVDSDNSGTNGRLARANLDGSAVEVLLTGLPDPRGITVDANRSRMTWTEASGFGRIIRQARLDGTGLETLDFPGIVSPFRLAFFPG